MAEKTLTSPGVTTREIDLSGPTNAQPFGVPAGVIGTANRGPAFVPVTFGTTQDFYAKFGATDGKKFGPLAISEWMKNATAGTYMRVLGAGNGKTRSTSTGIVTNAGFIVGAKLPQANGLIAANTYANSTAATGQSGSIHFLSCLMSESAGSTVFSTAGLQTIRTAFAVDAIDTTGATAGLAANDVAFTINFPTTAGGDGAVVTIVVEDDDDDGSGAAAASQIGIGFATGPSDTLIRDAVIAALNGTADARITYAASGDGMTPWTTSGVTATAGTTATTITLTATSTNPSSNDGALAASGPGINIILKTTLVGGGATAIPILRGVLMAPSGVNLTLSGARSDNTNTPLSTTAATVAGPFGFATGSVNISGSQAEFVMLLNGHIGTDTYPRIISASLNTTSPSYISKIFNRDPFKLEEAGHLLYAHYDIQDALAVVTGSGLIAADSGLLDNSTNRLWEDIAFLVTGSAQGGAGSSGRPDYKNWQNRFATSASPWIMSQANVNLFRVHALDDGQVRAVGNAKAPKMPGANDRYKLTIRNIRKSSSATDLFGTFDLVIRDFYDTDDSPIILESFSGLTLDQSSPNYLPSRVGDLMTYFDFDKPDDEQRLVVVGSYPNVSNYVRIELSPDVVSKTVADDSLPIGFRGQGHLVLSGSEALAPAVDENIYAGVPTDLRYSAVGMMNEPPSSFREHLISNTSGSISAIANKKLHWGMQFERKIAAAGPNVSQLPDPTMTAMTSYYPDFRLGVTNAFTGSNAGDPRLNGGLLDSDLFNNNMFTLNNLRIVTGSNDKVDTATVLDWRYIREGGITPEDSTKTRALSVADDYGDSALIQYLKFNCFIQGGFNGLNMFNKAKEDMSNLAIRREMDDVSSESLKSSATVAAYLKGLEIMGRTSDVEIQLLAIPGIRHSSVTDEAINTVENRFDALYLMDIEERDALNNVITSSVDQPHVQNTVSAFSARALDSSFAAAYFPDVTMTDPVKNTLVEVPPTVTVLGAFSLNDKLAHPWYAPAGFTRGSLASTEDVSVRINQDNADRLYEADINPIRTFPGRQGVTVFGQKTLQQAQSALDRINVRRLLIDIRRQVRTIANRFLFEPNREATLAAFSSTIQPVMQRIQQQQGIDRYKIIIDTTTTTQADVENNTIRGKIFLQPTRSIEFVSLDFVVTNAGAEE